MKWLEVLKAPWVAPKKDKKQKQITVAETENYLIMDLWEKGKARCRHAMEKKTGEPGTYYPDSGNKTAENLSNAAGYEYSYWGGLDEKEWQLQPEGKKIILRLVKNKWQEDALRKVLEKEQEYKRDKRWEQANRKEMRLRALMELCPAPGKAVFDWIAKQAVGDLQYAFWDKVQKRYHCTACNSDFAAQAKHKEEIICPLCGSRLTANKRGESVSVKTRLTMIHDVDEKRGVERHFEVVIRWKEKRTVSLEELIRVMLLRDGKYACKIYYDDGWGGWSEGNRANRRWKTSYLYPDREGIQAGLEGTPYAVWKQVMPMLAEAGIEAEYNGLLVESNQCWVNIAEYMSKGRFYQLLKEETDMISYWGGYLGGSLRVNGKSIEEVLKLEDRQKINRIRQENGGRNMLKWLQWSEETGKKISTECLQWYEKEKISVDAYQLARASKHMSPEQLMHYLTRQGQESYKGRKAAAVFQQLEDYLSMANTLKKNLDDELVYRPRELKRRHDELNMEISRRNAEIQRKMNKEAAKKQAEEMRKKYPGYEDILREIKKKYEYGNEKYCIRVPKDFAEITAEGMALHHCAGNTERYFDRIVSRETYICFLRKKENPKEPYYTIEVEPGGTIRQHRGYLDEEPEIEEVKPFLQEWQKVIRKRMRKEDHEYAKRSAMLREKNIQELKEKKNTRVLEGLMEDLMEVI